MLTWSWTSFVAFCRKLQSTGEVDQQQCGRGIAAHGGMRRVSKKANEWRRDGDRSRHDGERDIEIKRTDSVGNVGRERRAGRAGAAEAGRRRGRALASTVVG